MSTSDEITLGGAAPPLATLALLGAPPLIKGENASGYDELLARICATLQPVDCLEEIWIRDVIDLVWETFRLRRLKASLLTDATTQLAAYFAGKRTCFDLPLTFGDGTPFQQQVWTALCDIPYGETISYGRLATRIGQPGAARAVGLANNRNPIAIIVPCHRVIGASGSLTGYGGGLERKTWLIDHERRWRTNALF